MKIDVLGTGMVGVAIATKLVQLGHQVTMGARAAKNEKAMAWAKGLGQKSSHIGTFRDAAKAGAVVFNCTRSMGSLDALTQASTDALDGKVLIDMSNPLDFSHGMPPTLSVCNTDSLGEQLQRAFPKAKVVRALNTITAPLMVDPRALPEQTTTFVAGNDDSAKATVTTLLKEFGWRDSEIVDAGTIQASRGLEAWVLLWVQLMGTIGTPMFNLRLVSAI